jgi:colanic acid biosynthesis glycosyl transferase WcaI
VDIHLWSYNFHPEPTGIAPLSTVWAREMQARGHRVTVIAAHPHYPEPVWEHPPGPYRETIDGIDVLRLPLKVGREDARARIRQEASFGVALGAVSTLLPKPDVLVAVSPSFPALAPAMLFGRARRIPWVLWLQDILPDGATATGIIPEGRFIDAMRRFERLAYREAARIVVISESFRTNLRAKAVPLDKIETVYNVATAPLEDHRSLPFGDRGLTVLTMGNVGRSQNLVAVTEAFQAHEGLRELDARFVMAGDGIDGERVRAAIRDPRIELTGLLGGEALDRRLESAAVALVSQDYAGIDFNVPSKLMNFMAWGLPTVAAVRPESEVAGLIDRSGGGWVAGSPAEAADTLARVLPDHAERERRGALARAFAGEHFVPAVAAERFEAILEDVVARHGR